MQLLTDEEAAAMKIGPLILHYAVPVGAALCKSHVSTLIYCDLINSLIILYLDNERELHFCLLFGLQLLKQLQEL